MNVHRYFCTRISINPGHMQSAILPHIYLRVASSNTLVLAWMNPNKYTTIGTYSIVMEILKTNVKYR